MQSFLKYRPSKRDRAFLSIPKDKFARSHEILELKTEDLKFKNTSDDSKQHAEITINCKTRYRIVPLIKSNDKRYWIFVCYRLKILPYFLHLYIK